MRRTSLHLMSQRSVIAPQCAEHQVTAGGDNKCNDQSQNSVIFCPLSPVTALSRGAGESSCHFGRKNVYMKQYIMEANIKNTNTKRSQRRSQYSEIDLVGPSLFDATCQSLLKIKTMKLTVAQRYVLQGAGNQLLETKQLTNAKNT